MRRNTVGRGRWTKKLQRKSNIMLFLVCGFNQKVFLLTLWQTEILSKRLGLGDQLFFLFFFNIYFFKLAALKVFSALARLSAFCLLPSVCSNFGSVIFDIIRTEKIALHFLDFQPLMNTEYKANFSILGLKMPKYGWTFFSYSYKFIDYNLVWFSPFRNPEKKLYFYRVS